MDPQPLRPHLRPPGRPHVADRRLGGRRAAAGVGGHAGVPDDPRHPRRHPDALPPAARLLRCHRREQGRPEERRQRAALSAAHDRLVRPERALGPRPLLGLQQCAHDAEHGHRQEARRAGRARARAHHDARRARPAPRHAADGRPRRRARLGAAGAAGRVGGGGRDGRRRQRGQGGGGGRDQGVSLRHRAKPRAEAGLRQRLWQRE
mmetsp:Transcript_82480/g.200119  ORF Transcript_82480/g.200119 Transcript_82480/m.200119 type:complete len:206 (-) Transcript_82480:155-772(-)